MWASQYRESSLKTVEGWIYLAACAITCRVGEEEQHERRCREVGRVAFENQCCIWHAVWLTGDPSNECYCAPCVKARLNL